MEQTEFFEEKVEAKKYESDDWKTSRTLGRDVQCDQMLIKKLPNFYNRCPKGAKEIETKTWL